VELVDLIYEAAFVPELWPRLLDQLAQVSRSVGSALFLFGDNGLGRGVTLDNLNDLLGQFLTNKDLRFSTSVVRMCDLKPNSFVEVDGYMSPTEIERDPIRIELRARGMGVHICTAVPMPTGDIAIYVLQKPLGMGGYDADEIDRLNELRPHLARTGLIAARLGLEKAKSTVAALESLGLAAAVCSKGWTIAANSMFLNQPDLFRIGGQDRLTVASGPANALLQAALGEGGAPQTVRSIPLTEDIDAGPAPRAAAETCGTRRPRRRRQHRGVHLRQSQRTGPGAQRPLGLVRSHSGRSKTGRKPRFRPGAEVGRGRQRHQVQYRPFLPGADLSQNRHQTTKPARRPAEKCRADSLDGRWQERAEPDRIRVNQVTALRQEQPVVSLAIMDVG
jgi:hypothetical protein